MSKATRSNAITFKRAPFGDQVQSTRIALTLEGSLSYTAGNKPNTFRAVVSYLEFAKLGDVIDMPGDVELWYLNNPGDKVATTAGDTTAAKPDVTLSQWRIVDVQIAETGQTPDDPDTLKIVSYRLFFADWRERLIPPRGQRLRMGLINSGPKPAAGVGKRETINGILTIDGVPELDLNDLVRIAVESIPSVDPVVPPELANVDAPRNVQWLGNPAAGELAKLMDLGAAVLCPNFAAEGAGDWMGRVEMIKTASELPVNIKSPDEAFGIMPSVELPIIDRRGKTVIFSSYPLPTAETISVNGPRDDRFYFVIQDSKGNWVREGECDLLQPSSGTNPNGAESDGPQSLLDAWKQNFIRIRSTFRQQMASQAFRFIKLGDGTNAPQGANPNTVQKLAPAKLMPILSRMIEKDGTYKDISVVARYARYFPEHRQFQSTGGYEQVKACFKDDANIIQLLSPLINVTNPTTDPNKDATLTGVDFNVTFTVPQCRQQDPAADGMPPGPWGPQYFHVGFRRKPADENGETLQQLSDEEIKNALAGTDSGSDPDIIFLARPELRVFVVGDIPRNQDAVIAQAKLWADGMLANSAQPTKVIKVRGFATARIDGHVSGLEWTQHPAQTTITVNDWYRPGGAMDAAELMDREMAGFGEGGAGAGAKGAAYPNQPSTQETRIALSEPGATRPMIPLSPAVVDPPYQAGCAADLATAITLATGGATPDTHGWNTTAARSLVMDLVTGVNWDGLVLSYNTRQCQFDGCGKLIVVGFEVKHTIDNPQACS